MSQEKAWKEQRLSCPPLDPQLLGSTGSQSHGEDKQAKKYFKTVWETRDGGNTLSLWENCSGERGPFIEYVRAQILTQRHRINMGLTLTKGGCGDAQTLGEDWQTHPKRWWTSCALGAGKLWPTGQIWTTLWFCTARKLRMVFTLFNGF